MPSIENRPLYFHQFIVENLADGGQPSHEQLSSLPWCIHLFELIKARGGEIRWSTGHRAAANGTRVISVKWPWSLAVTKYSFYPVNGTIYEDGNGIIKIEPYHDLHEWNQLFFIMWTRMASELISAGGRNRVAKAFKNNDWSYLVDKVSAMNLGDSRHLHLFSPSNFALTLLKPFDDTPDLALVRNAIELGLIV